jgi:hypothetical protein
MRSDSDVEIEEPVDMEGDEEEEGFESEEVEGVVNHSEEDDEEDEINSVRTVSHDKRCIPMSALHRENLRRQRKMKDTWLYPG